MTLFSGSPHNLIRKEITPFDPRLGRHVVHDTRSFMFSIPTIRGDYPTKDIRHRRYGPKLDQGNQASCVGHAGAHALNCDPFRKYFLPKPTFTHQDAVNFYAKATELDDINGTFPPHDTGTSGLYVCRAMQLLNIIKGYQWAFGFKHGLEAISSVPLMQGTYWHEEMTYPTKEGQVFVKGAKQGGHEYLWIGVELRNRVNPSQNRSWFLNSWGNSWGVNGYFWMLWKDHERLLAADGDLIHPVLN